MQKPEIRAEIQQLADQMCREAGLITDWGHATGAMVALMQLTASRCLDVLDQATPAPTQYADIARMFAVAPAADAIDSEVVCRAELQGCPWLTARQRRLAENIFTETLRQKLGGFDAVFKHQRAWRSDPKSTAGRRWLLASELAALLVKERMEHLGVAPNLREVPAASFRLEFIHAIA